jgi:Flp pilus assembly protein CpaB
VGTLQDNGKSVAKTVLENIMVLAVGSRTGPAQPVEPGQPVEQARTVTLLCTPEQAEKLELATASTRVRLVLRNGEDKSTLSTDGVTLADLRGKSQGTDIFSDSEATLTSDENPATQPVAELPGEKKQWTVEIIRAGAQSTQVFELENSKPKAHRKQDPFGPVTGGVEIDR